MCMVSSKGGRQSCCRSGGELQGGLALGPSGQSPWGRRGHIPPFVSLVAEALQKEQGTGAVAAANLPVLQKPWRRTGRGTYCSRGSPGLQLWGQRKHPSFKRAVYEMSPPVLRYIPPDAAIGVTQLSISSTAVPNCISLLTLLSDLLHIVIYQRAASVLLSIVGLCVHF